MDLGQVVDRIWERASPYVHSLSSLRVSTLVSFFLAILAAYELFSVVYNLYFHKLSRFPGPLLARSTLLWQIYYSQRGTLHYAIRDAHRKYGSVVRVLPNELSFSSVESWKAIYGHRPSGEPQPRKGDFYDIYGAGFTSGCIGSERNPARHSQMRKMMMPAFSTKVLLEQEEIVANSVDKFVSRLGEVGAGPGGMNMTKWFEMVAFDTLGEMAFGESFHGVETGKSHAWYGYFHNYLYLVTVVDNLRRIPWLVALVKLLFPRQLVRRNPHSQFSRRKVDERLAKKTDRNDFVTAIIREYKAGHIPKEEVVAHVSTLALAGGETTATFLAATTYYLLQNPTCLQRLQGELDQAFPTFDSINSTAARQLPYLQAVISEGFRIYPPGAVGFPRMSLGVMVGEHYVPPGAEMFTHAWTLARDEANFANPSVFNPDRWLDPESTDVKAASQPFVLGPRACIGQNFALMEVYLIVAKMFWKYDMELVNTDLDWEKQSRLHIMWWKPDLMVRFKERKHAE
ncbi:cytochrome P450 [Naviculisporaceae sp. PSN 640]